MTKIQNTKQKNNRFASVPEETGLEFGAWNFGFQKVRFRRFRKKFKLKACKFCNHEAYFSYVE
jgi:hypothetical protein